MKHWIRILSIVCLLMGGMMVSTQQVLAKDEFLSKYDDELKTPPFAIRYKYMKENGKSWKSTTYDERLNFIRGWEKGQKQRDKEELRQERLDARQEAIAERNKLREKRKEERREQLRERERQRKKRQEEKEEREFENKVAEQKQRLEELKQHQERRKNQLRN